MDPVVVPAEEGVEGLVVPVEGGGDQRLVGDLGNDAPTLVVAPVRGWGVIKLVFCLRRRDGMTLEEFQRYWREDHEVIA